MSNGIAWGQVVHYDGSQAWGIAPDLQTVYLGKETDVKAAVSNEKLTYGDPIIDGIISLERQLQRKGNKNGNIETRPVNQQRTIRTRGIRVRPVNNSEYKPVRTGHTKTRQRIPGGKVESPEPSVFGQLRLGLDEEK